MPIPYCRLAALPLAMVLSTGAQAQVSDGVVKMGVLTDMSGPYSNFGGNGSVAATHMAIEDCLKAECTGMEIEVLSADHHGRVMHDMSLVEVKTPAQCKGAWDDYNILGTIPAASAVMPLAQSQCAFVKSGCSNGFATDLMPKDLGLAVQAASDAQATAPLGSLVRNLFFMHSAAGNGRLDLGSIFGLLAPRQA